MSQKVQPSPPFDAVVIPLWNKTSVPKDQITSPVRVLATKSGRSQTGLLYEVEKRGGEKVWLDSAWFASSANLRGNP